MESTREENQCLHKLATEAELTRILKVSADSQIAQAQAEIESLQAANDYLQETQLPELEKTIDVQQKVIKSYHDQI